MAPQDKAKYRTLFEDPNVKRWYDNISRGSPVTADVYLDPGEPYTKGGTVIFRVSKVDGRS
jgi:hypothetical protein